MAKGARPKAGYSKCTKPDPEWIEEANLSILGSCKRKKRGKAKPKPSKKPVPAEEVSKKQKACKVVEVPVYDEENSPSSESSSSSQSAKSMTTKLAKFAAKQKAGQPWEVLFFAFNLCHASTGWKKLQSSVDRKQCRECQKRRC